MGGDIEYPGIFGCWSGRFNSETWLMVALALTPRTVTVLDLDLSREPTRGNDYHTLPYPKQASLIEPASRIHVSQSKKDVVCSLFFYDKLLPSYSLFHPVLFSSYIIGDSYLSLPTGLPIASLPDLGYLNLLRYILSRPISDLHPLNRHNFETCT
jgi:hypothetical protein